MSKTPQSAAERLELGAILLLTLGALALWAFAALAGRTADGDAVAFDRWLLLALRAPDDPDQPFGPPWLREMGRDVTALGGVAVLTLLTAVVTGFMLMRRLWHAAALLVLAVASGVLASELLKRHFERERPDLVPHGSLVDTASFPSGHAMMAAVVYLSLGALVARAEPGRRTKAFVLTVAVGLAVLVGVSRVYLGVHWPTDVLAGWALGTAWALMFWLLARWLGRRGRFETDRGEE